MKKMVIYTAIFDGKDSLKDPIGGAVEEADYVCFSDSPISSKIWRRVPFLRKFINPRLDARLIKTLPHRFLPGYCFWVWIDASLRMKRPENITGRGDLVSTKHPERDCIYQEISTCIRERIDSAETLSRVSGRYLSEGYPPRRGLSQTGFLIRKNSPEVVRFCESWWAEISAGSLRDQCSFEYVSWRQGPEITRISLQNWRDNEFFKYEGHLKWR